MSGEQQAVRAVSAGADWTTDGAIGFRIGSDGGTVNVFGIIVSTRKPGSRWVKRFTCWQKDPHQSADEMMDALEAMFGQPESFR